MVNYFLFMGCYGDCILLFNTKYVWFVSLEILFVNNIMNRKQAHNQDKSDYVYVTLQMFS